MRGRFAIDAARLVLGGISSRIDQDGELTMMRAIDTENSVKITIPTFGGNCRVEEVKKTKVLVGFFWEDIGEDHHLRLEFEEEFKRLSSLT